MSWISLPDMVAAILRVLDDPALAGPVNCSSPEPATNAEFTRALAAALHRPAILPVPAFALRLIFGELADSLLGSARLKPAKLEAAGFVFAHPKLAQAFAAVLPG
jgi:NAD dependent epimerase/dehydratase family enzyme